MSKINYNMATNSSGNRTDTRELALPSEEGGHCARNRGGWVAFPLMTGCAMGLSIAATASSTNLIVYLIKVFNIKSINAAEIYAIVNGCTSVTPVAGAILADSFFGSFSIVTISALASLLGTVLFLLTAMVDSLRPSTCETPSRIQLTVLYAAIALAPIGIGGTRATMASMGADQFDSEKDRSVFFNWYFFTTYLGSAIGSTAIVYIEDNVGWAWGFGIAVVANAVGLALFLLGKRYYRLIKPQGSPFSSLARVAVATIRKTREPLPSEGKEYFNDLCADNKSLSPSASFRFLNRAAIKTQGDTHQDGSVAKPWRLCTVQEVEDLKTLFRVFPIWTTGIFTCTSVGILMSLVVLQALTMDRHLGPHFQVPSGSFLGFLLLSSAICLSILDRFLFPTIQKLRNKAPTPLQRVGVGHIMNITGMAVSALIESRRLHIARSHHLVDQAAGSNLVPMSALWLVFPLAFAGFSEAFCFPGQVAFFYQEFPKSLRSTSTAMTSLLLGIGFYLSTAVVNLVQNVTDWLPDNINKGRLDNVYWLLAVIGVINFGFYLTCSILYKHKNVEKSEEN